MNEEQRKKKAEEERRRKQQMDSECTLTGTNGLLNPLNPLSPVSPLNPMNYTYDSSPATDYGSSASDGCSGGCGD